jgi:hypothetical protein
VQQEVEGGKVKEKKTEVVGNLDCPEVKMSLDEWEDYWNAAVNNLLATSKYEWANLQIAFIWNYDDVSFELSGDRYCTKQEIARNEKLRVKKALKAKVARKKKEARDLRDYERLKKKYEV